MEQQLHKVFENLKENKQILNEILNEMLERSTNKKVADMLETIQINYDDIPRIERLVESISYSGIYALDIGSEIPKGFDTLYTFYISEDYDDETLVSIEFLVDENNIVTDVESSNLKIEH